MKCSVLLLLAVAQAVHHRIRHQVGLRSHSHSVHPHSFVKPIQVTTIREPYLRQVRFLQEDPPADAPPDPKAELEKLVAKEKEKLTVVQEGFLRIASE